MATIKLLLKVILSEKWFLTQHDISYVFLNGELEEELYIKLPEGYVERMGDSLSHRPVLRLKKSIYGLNRHRVNALRNLIYHEFYSLLAMVYTCFRNYLFCFGAFLAHLQVQIYRSRSVLEKNDDLSAF